MATNDKVFDLLRRDIPGRNQIGRNKKKPIQPPNMGTKPPVGRDPSDDAPVWGTGDMAPPAETGQQEGGPGWGYGTQSAIRWGQSGGDAPYGTGDAPGMENMNDTYDYWVSQTGGGSWNDFWQYYNTAGNTQNLDWMMEGDYEWGPYDWTVGGGIGGQSYSGGGASGGAGDLGLGNMFTGGGTPWDPITNPFGQGWGPGGQYETTEPGTGSAVDDSMAVDDDCFAAWQQSGAAESYADFAAAMCSG